MRTAFQQHSARRRPNLNLGFILLFLACLGCGIPQNAKAQTVDDRFEQYIIDACNFMTVPPIVLTLESFTLCQRVSAGGPVVGGPTYLSSSNLGTAAARSGTTLRQPQSIKDRLDERKEEMGKAASADGSGWGLLMSPQYGKSNRPQTELENGFQAELKGLLVGLDYRFSDNFVLGSAIAHTKDEADFISNAGFLNSISNTFTLYGTWAPSDTAYLDGYLGAGKMDYDSQRRVVFGTTISGTASGNTSGSQIMGGLSTGYTSNSGNVNFGPFINLDYIKTHIDGYDESGSTLLELRYSDRSSVSMTSGLGVQASMASNYNWGSLVPSMRLAAVHEYKNGSRRIDSTVVVAPTQPFLVDTDEPDRNYALIGLGIAAALNGGTQAFVNYEKRSKDKLLHSWAVSVGVLAEF